MPDSATLATALLLTAAAALLIAAMFYPSAMLRWFQRKRYQYEVTFSLYMLTSTEKFIFSTPVSIAQPSLSQHHTARYPPSLHPGLQTLTRPCTNLSQTPCSSSFLAYSSSPPRCISPSISASSQAASSTTTVATRTRTPGA